LRTLALLLVLAAPAYADLYRWVDADSGSVKFSNLPPADPRLGAELLPYRGAPKPAAASSSSLVALEMRWRALVVQRAARSPQDMARDRGVLRQELETGALVEHLRAR